MKKKLKLFFKNLFLNTNIYYYDYIPVKEILGTYDFNDGRNHQHNDKIINPKVQALIKRYEKVGFDENYYIEVFKLLGSAFKINNKVFWPSKNKLNLAEEINQDKDKVEMMPQYKYRSTDGNHRLCAAKHFYGEDYKILAVVIHNKGKSWEMQHIHKLYLSITLMCINILFLILLLLT